MATYTVRSKSKVPGLDGIPSMYCIEDYNPDVSGLVKDSVAVLDDSYFPDIWKIQMVVLLPKPDKPSGNLSENTDRYV